MDFVNPMTADLVAAYACVTKYLGEGENPIRNPYLEYFQRSSVPEKF